MTLTFHLEICFKVTAHLLTNSILWMEHEPDWAKGREKYAPDKKCQTPIRTDYRAPAKLSPYFRK